MSVEAIAWALNVPVGGNAKVVLLGVANHADPDGGRAWPSLTTLARYAHCHRNTARSNLRALVADGWLIEDGTGPKGTQRFRLPIGGTETGPVGERGGTASEREGVQNGARGGTAQGVPEPSLGTVLEPSESAGAGANDQISLDVPEERVDAFLAWHSKQVVGLGLAAPRVTAAARRAARDLLRLSPGDDLRAMFGYGKDRPFYASKVRTMAKWRQWHDDLRSEWLASRVVASRRNGRSDQPDRPAPRASYESDEVEISR